MPGLYSTYGSCSRYCELRVHSSLHIDLLQLVIGDVEGVTILSEPFSCSYNYLGVGDVV